VGLSVLPVIAEYLLGQRDRQVTHEAERMRAIQALQDWKAKHPGVLPSD
jgi:hypothetical protein